MGAVGFFPPDDALAEGGKPGDVAVGGVVHELEELFRVDQIAVLRGRLSQGIDAPESQENLRGRTRYRTESLRRMAGLLRGLSYQRLDNAL